MSAAQQQTSKDSSHTQPTPLQRFKFLDQQLPLTPTSALVRPTATAAEELGDYINNLQCDTDDDMPCWLERDCQKKLPAWAVDILSAPSSEAFVEQFFSACGDFTTGKSNRTL